MKIYRRYAVLTVLLGLFAMIYAGKQILDTQKIYQEGSAVYENLRDKIKTERTDTADESRIYEENTQTGFQTPGENIDGIKSQDIKTPRVYIPELDINFETLRDINKDSAAWLYSPDTVIDYPVMQAKDYYYYLYRLPDGTKNANGSLFIDYNHAPDFSDPLTIIYGHHMKTGNMMFGSFKEYNSQEYYENHKYIYLYTENQNYRIDLIYGFVISAREWRDGAFTYPENIGLLMDYAMDNTTFESGAKLKYKEGDDRIIALSTCSYEFDDARYVLIGVLRTG